MKPRKAQIIETRIAEEKYYFMIAQLRVLHRLSRGRKLLRVSAIPFNNEKSHREEI